MRRKPGQQAAHAVEKPPFEAVLDHYGIRYVNKHGWQKVRCPFHDDTEPSMSINLGAGFSCHACVAKGGDVYDFVKLKERCDFVAAKRIVADITGFDLQPQSSGRQPGRKGGVRLRFGQKDTQ